VWTTALRAQASTTGTFVAFPLGVKDRNIERLPMAIVTFPLRGTLINRSVRP
jgi:hypothetical protein